ncbi:capsule assembly Wzi family protein [Marinobacter nauticus]|uniref:capsule assembly Wzi family protein n=1 Tax=Marinobacter nauticus TaxID=2743 RepID=UPI001C99942F|nr:capsule assembly Wzi family protein [Marinobacter nauticus]MBY5937651.1 capsule assembly Wzi family protein [Marinobacter nauticus]MBY5954879.1 capsule assembly Wzi family protein [Marinobacter nauticus]MBY6008672.1 capsule assembly Wzi family protein [Marinobacter nauticus]
MFGVQGLAISILTAAVAGQAAAAPWLEPGDPRARHAVQQLADRGHLNRTVTTWPMMWATVDSGLKEQGSAHTDATVTSANAYLSFEQNYQAVGGMRNDFTLAGTTETPFIRGFDGGPREAGEATARVELQAQNWAARASFTYALDPEDDESIRLDGSYLAGTAANWVLGAGAIDRWWGPGWSNSLILSTNARPMPAVWLNRKDAKPFESQWLSWIGPWQFTVFAGQYEKERAVPNAKLIGMRATFRPVQGLDIGLSRAIMFGGDGRPEDASTIWNAFIGKDNGQLEENDPGNQIASIDIRYGFPVGDNSMSVYSQMMGEDEAGAFPARKSWLLGTDWTTSLGDSQQQWYLEYTNTTADEFLGDAIPSITYEHSTYQTGYRYYGRNMASTFEGDAEAATLGAYNFFPNGHNLRVGLTWADLNTDGRSRVIASNSNVFYNVPTFQQEFLLLDVIYGFPFANGWLTLKGQAFNEGVIMTSGDKDESLVSVAWKFRF